MSSARRSLATTIVIVLFLAVVSVAGEEPDVVLLPWNDPSEQPVSLEDEFFELMWLCDSPLEEERDAAQEELTRRFDEFEPVWQDRTFLADGEIGDESRRRFELAESGYREACVARALECFSVRWFVDAATDDEGTPTRNATARISWSEPLRFVWMTPDFSAFVWRDPETGQTWRPRGRFASPEILPEYDATQVDLDFALEPGETTEDASESTVVFEALMGVDLRPFAAPVVANAEDAKILRSGELTLNEPTAAREPDGSPTTTFRVEYDDAGDAFNSFRTWYDARDFLLVCPDIVDPIAPTRLRPRDRNPKGERVELRFDADPKLDAATRDGAAVLYCRLPRFFVRARVSL